MNKQEQIKELQQKIISVDNDLWENVKKRENVKPYSREYFGLTKRCEKLDNIKQCLIAKCELLKGVIYHEEKWITKITSDLCDSLEEARKNLLDKLSKLDGVKVINDKSGVKLIEVLTKNKVYHYEIRAHYTNEKVGEKVSEGMFGGKFVENILVQKYIAYCDKNIFNALRGEYYWQD